MATLFMHVMIRLIRLIRGRSSALYVRFDIKGHSENAVALLGSSFFPLRFRDSSDYRNSLRR